VESAFGTPAKYPFRPIHFDADLVILSIPCRFRRIKTEQIAHAGVINGSMNTIQHTVGVVEGQTTRLLSQIHHRRDSRRGFFSCGYHVSCTLPGVERSMGFSRRDGSAVDSVHNQARGTNGIDGDLGFGQKPADLLFAFGKKI
jgi:hypothetical protein